MATVSVDEARFQWDRDNASRICFDRPPLGRRKLRDVGTTCAKCPDSGLMHGFRIEVHAIWRTCGHDLCSSSACLTRAWHGEATCKIMVRFSPVHLAFGRRVIYTCRLQAAAAPDIAECQLQRPCAEGRQGRGRTVAKATMSFRYVTYVMSHHKLTTASYWRFVAPFDSRSLSLSSASKAVCSLQLCFLVGSLTVPGTTIEYMSVVHDMYISVCIHLVL